MVLKSLWCAVPAGPPAQPACPGTQRALSSLASAPATDSCYFSVFGRSFLNWTSKIVIADCKNMSWSLASLYPTFMTDDRSLITNHELKGFKLLLHRVTQEYMFSTYRASKHESVDGL